jgi:malate synthase
LIRRKRQELTVQRSTVNVLGPHVDRQEELLTPAALDFLAQLDYRFSHRRAQLLDLRLVRRRVLDEATLRFRPETAWIRNDPTWRVAPPPADLTDRRVEITGPPTRRRAVGALNSGASVWMADFEDALSPTWANIVDGQLCLIDALEGRADFTSAEGTRHRLGPSQPTMVVRPRGWHLTEKHLVLDGRPLSASLVDAGLYLFHCAQRQISRGSGPYLYLPKVENHLEARLWNDVLCAAQDALGIQRGTVRVTVLIETITAAFEMEEILYELRDHVCGLNAGRWNYLFSVIKTFSRQSSLVLPDRSAVTMTTPFMRAFTELLVATCHQRGAHAIGGMAAAVPDRRDPQATARALAEVRADKQREARDGFDGSWVAHSDLVPVCRTAFYAALGNRPHQIDRTRDDVQVTAADLLAVGRTSGAVTEDGVRANIEVSLAYLEAWLRGSGAVAINGLMEDAATVEVSRCQLWQWMHAEIRLTDGRVVTRELVEALAKEELARLRQSDAGTGRWDDALDVLTRVAMAQDLPAFTTSVAYTQYLVDRAATLPRPRAVAQVTAEPDVSPAAALLALSRPVAALG